MTKTTAECAHCGEEFEYVSPIGEIITHGIPPCPGSGEPPRRSKDTPLWKDNPNQREKDFLDTATMELHLLGFAVVKNVAKMRGNGAGSMTCPLCGHRVQYSIAKNNKHCRAVCERPGCINVME